MIYKYFKECKKLIVLITLLGMLIGMLFFITKDTPPTLVLKKKKSILNMDKLIMLILKA